MTSEQMLYTFPLKAGSKEPAVKDWENWCTAPRTWDQVMTRLEATGMPQGIACGPSRLVVIDCDVDRDTGKPVGLNNFLGLCSENRYFLNTLEVATPSGGSHFYFRAPDWHLSEAIRNSSGKLGRKIDVRAAGGYVVAPGVQLEGNRYRLIWDGCEGARAAWDHHWGPVVVRCAPLPAWLCDALKRRPEPPARPLAASGPVGEGYGSKALQGELEALAATPEGGRNHRLNEAAFNLGQLVGGGVLELDYVRDHLYATARSIGLTDREIRKTLVSGLSAGARQPRGR